LFPRLKAAENNGEIKNSPQAQALLEQFAEEIESTNDGYGPHGDIITILDKFSKHSFFNIRDYGDNYDVSKSEDRIRMRRHPANAAYDVFWNLCRKNVRKLDDKSVDEFKTQMEKLPLSEEQKQTVLEVFADRLVKIKASYRTYNSLIQALEALKGQMLFDPHPTNRIVIRHFCKGATQSEIDNATKAWEAFHTSYKNPKDNAGTIGLLKKHMGEISVQKRQILLVCIARHFALTCKAMWRKHKSLYTALNELSQTTWSPLTYTFTRDGYKVKMNY